MGYDAEGACCRTGKQHHQQHCQWMEAESESKEGKWGLEEKEESWEWNEREKSLTFLTMRMRMTLLC